MNVTVELIFACRSIANGYRNISNPVENIEKVISSIGTYGNVRSV